MRMSYGNKASGIDALAHNLKSIDLALFESVPLSRPRPFLPPVFPQADISYDCILLSFILLQHSSSVKVSANSAKVSAPDDGAKSITSKRS